MFYECISLKEIVIEGKINEVGEDAFWETEYRKSNEVIILNSILLSYSGSSSEFIIPDSVVSIAEGAFRACTSLTYIFVPDSVQIIGKVRLEIA